MTVVLKSQFQKASNLQLLKFTQVHELLSSQFTKTIIFSRSQISLHKTATTKVIESSMQNPPSERTEAEQKKEKPICNTIDS